MTSSRSCYSMTSASIALSRNARSYCCIPSSQPHREIHARLPSRSLPRRTTLPQITAARECSVWLVVAPLTQAHHAAAAVVIGFLVRENYVSLRRA